MTKTSEHFPLAAITVPKACANSSTTIGQKIAESLRQLQAIDRIASKKDVDAVNSSVKTILACLPGPITPEKLLRLDENIYMDWQSIAQNEYAAVLESLLRLMDGEWPGGDSIVQAELIELFTMEDNKDFIIESLSALAASKNIGKFAVLVTILERMITSHTLLFSLFTHLSYDEQLSGVEASAVALRQTQIVQILVSLPNVVANQLQGKISNVFIAETYSCFLLMSMLKTIYFIAKAPATAFNTNFLSKLYSRILVDFNQGRTSQVLPKTLRILEIWSQSNDRLRDLTQSLLLGLNRNAIDVAGVYLLHCEHTSTMLGNAVQSSTDWRYCFHAKLPLLSCFKDDRMIVNLVRYLTQQSEASDQYQLFVEVLKAWASKVSIATHTVDQHLYLTKFILLSSSLFTIHDTPEQTGNIKKILHRGVQNHIESLNPTLRAIGMITGEVICNKTSGSEDELHFDYTSFSGSDKKMVDGLKEISEITLLGGTAYEGGAPADENTVFQELYAIIEGSNSNAIMRSTAVTGNSLKRTHQTEIEYGALSVSSLPKLAHTEPGNRLDEDDLDSDDDLEPTDMSHDTGTETDHTPRYLIDLRENLLETEDPDVFQASMETCAQLINDKLPNDDHRLGIDLLRILMSLEQKFPVDDFYGCRLAGCIAITCVYPKESAEYLCQEFHAETGRYSITKKVLMLEILSESARSLSQLTKRSEPLKAIPSTNSSSAPKKLLELNDDVKRVDDAKRIIRERIEKKTRRFAHKSTNPTANAQRNRFADVAGYFFFPLLYGFGKQQLALATANCTLKYDTDNVLLVTFLQTVSTVVFASQNCPIATKFGPEVFSLCTILRFHGEPRVRLGILYTIAAVFMVVPKDSLLAYSFNDICEIRTWLEQMLSLNILRSEKDVECREMAKHVLALCMDIMS